MRKHNADWADDQQKSQAAQLVTRFLSPNGGWPAREGGRS